jgi:hypothetical protein
MGGFVQFSELKDDFQERNSAVTILSAEILWDSASD